MGTQMIYHIMIDRFAGCAPKRKGRCFKGGNLRGIIKKLDYIQSLGCNGILLTPFYKTNEYHGYHITDYEQVDDHFGSWSDVQDLVKAVHEHGLTITADFVANHCHISNPLVTQHPDWFKKKKDGSPKYFYGIEYLPEFNLDKVGARCYMVDRMKHLCHIGFDAIRLDYAKGPSLNCWHKVREEIKRDYPNVLLIGEILGPPNGKHLPRSLALQVERGTISRQEAWQLCYVGILDGVLDFEYQSLMCKAAKSAERIAENKSLETAVTNHFNHYADYPDYHLWLLLDNHDFNRFLYECGGDVALLKEAIAFSQAHNHPYLLYYGTEKGMTHSGNRFSGEPYADEHVRKCMEWNKQSIFKTI